MKSFARHLIVFLSPLLLLSCGGKKTGWTTYTSGDGGFSVLMPSGVALSEKMEVTPFGKQKTKFVAWKPTTFSMDKFKLFQVSYCNASPGLATDSVMREFLLDSSIEMRKKDFSEKDYPSEKVEINGYSGRALIFDNPTGNTVVIVRQFIANNRRYDLTVVAKKNMGTNEEINTFFNSFTIIH